MSNRRHRRLIVIQSLYFEETVQGQCFGQRRQRGQQLPPSTALLAAVGILEPAPGQHRPRHLVESVHHVSQRIGRQQAIRVQ